MRRIAAWALLLLATPCVAQQTESITVNASALVGTWKVSQPQYVAKRGVFEDFKFGPLYEKFCRIEQDGQGLAIHCLARDEGRVTLDRGNIRMAWGSRMARIAIEGVLRPDLSFAGHESFRLAGIAMLEDSKLSSGRKVDLSVPPADRAGMAQLLRDVIVDGLADVPHDGGVKESPALRTDLGSVQAIAYLGQQERFAPPGQLGGKGFFAVYAVEFEKGERICALHQRDDGTLDAFECV
jgi:hypothetical protein